jgi:O-antigen/teichoic acid export membrane protein
MKNINVKKLTDGNRIATNAMYSLIGQAIPMIAGVISIPILIKTLGTDRFGILTLSWIVISYFSLFDLGLGRALTQLVAERLGKGDDDRSISELTWTASILMLVLGIVGALLFLGISPWLVREVLNIPSEIQNETLHTFYILAFSIPLVTSTAGFVGFLSALQRFDLINLIKVPLGLFMFTAPLLALPFSNHLTFVVGILLIGRIIGWVIYAKLCIQAMPALLSYRNFSYKLLLPLIKFGGWMTLTNIIGPLMTYMDRFLISALISVTAVAYYATPYEIVTKLWIIPTALVTVLFPAFSTSFSEDPGRVEKLFYRGVRYIFLALFPIVLAIVLFAHELLDLWLGQEFAKNGAPVLQWLAIGVLINSLAQVPFSLIQGLGRPDITSKFHLFELPLYGLLLWQLTNSYGIIGAAYAWVIRIAIDTLILFLISQSMLSKKGMMVRDVFPIIFSIGTLIALSLINIDLYSKIILIVLLQITFICTAWKYILSNEEIRELKKIIDKKTSIF